MARTRAALALVAAGAVALAVVSGGSPADPRTPAGLPGLPAPFLGTAVVGSGRLTAAIDAYGDVVDLRAPGPAGRALIDNPAARQAAGTVASGTGIVPRVQVRVRAGASRSEANAAGLGGERPLWRAARVRQHYRPGTNVLATVARLGSARVEVVYAAHGGKLACLTHSSGPRISIEVEEPAAGARLHCDDAVARRLVAAAEGADRAWLARARPLGHGAPAWAARLYARSLLTLRALTDRRTGASAAGTRDGWAYVWPRDAGAAALAFAAAGYRPEARHIARFLFGLDLGAAARFHGDGTPVAGRATQGDAYGWATVAARAGGIPSPGKSPPWPPGESPPWTPAESSSWRNRSDYQEGERGTYLANAIAASGTELKPEPQPNGLTVGKLFEARRGLVRRGDDPGSGLDSAAAWAVRPFPLPALFPAVRRTLLRLASARTRFGITPGEAWAGTDPWTAPTAWSAWSLAALDRQVRHNSASAAHDRRAALRLLGDLRRAATAAGALPERVDARTGTPVSTTPLAWSHAFAILALRELWPSSQRRSHL